VLCNTGHCKEVGQIYIVYMSMNAFLNFLVNIFRSPWMLSLEVIRGQK